MPIIHCSNPSCDNTFYRKPAEISAKGNYCSRKCFQAIHYSPKELLRCDNPLCDKTFYRRRAKILSEQCYCSNTCRLIGQHETRSLTQCANESCRNTFYCKPSDISPSGNCCSRQCQQIIKTSHSALAARFWAHVTKTENCWLWTGATTRGGYGIMHIAGRKAPMRANRIAYMLVTGSLPHGKVICHTCDNPACVRNKEEGWYEVNGILYRCYGHLFAATQQRNILDALYKGHMGAKIQPEDVLHIRTLQGHESAQEIANRYGISVVSIRNIWRLETWKPLE